MSPPQRKVVVVVPFVDHANGMERIAVEHARRLAATDLDVTLLTCSHLRERPAAPQIEDGPNLRIARLPVLQRAPLLDLTWVLPGAVFVAARARSIAAVIAYQLPTAGVLAGLANQLRGVPFAAISQGSGEHGDLRFLHSLPAAGLRVRALQRADFVTAINGEAEREIVASGIDPQRVRRLPNTVDAERFQPPSKAERGDARRRLGLDDAPTIIFTGRLHAGKRVQWLVDAVALAHRDGIALNLVVAGDGPERGQLELSSRQLPTGRVKWLGRIADVRDVLHASDLFALPSESEGISNSLLEAMACGVVPIVSDAAGNLDVVADGRDAVVVSSPGPAPWSDAIVALASDPAGRRRLAAAARETVCRQFRHEVFDQTFLSWLESRRRR